jgi:hypothetical protein
MPDLQTSGASNNLKPGMIGASSSAAVLVAAAFTAMQMGIVKMPSDSEEIFTKPDSVTVCAPVAVVRADEKVQIGTLTDTLRDTAGHVTKVNSWPVYKMDTLGTAHPYITYRVASGTRDTHVWKFLTVCDGQIVAQKEYTSLPPVDTLLETDVTIYAKFNDDMVATNSPGTAYEVK